MHRCTTRGFMVQGCQARGSCCALSVACVPRVVQSVACVDWFDSLDS